MMNAAIAFDTLLYANKLKAVGVPEKQAEVQAEALAELINDNIATKRDLKELEVALKQDMASLKRDLAELEARMTIKLGSIMVAGIGIFAMLIKFL